MMKNSKKGVTLVELVIACVIMVLLGGACTAVLVSGQKLFISGSQTANNQLEANLLETTILKALPKMSLVEQDSATDVAAAVTPAAGTEEINRVGIYFDGPTENPILTISRNGAAITVNNVKEFKYSFKKVGTGDTAKTQFVYTAVMEDGSVVTGGVVLGNVIYKKDIEGKVSTPNINLASVNMALYFSSKKDDGI